MLPFKAPPDELAKYDFKFRRRETPELVRRSTTMCEIFNRRNELVGKASTAVLSEADPSEMRAASVTFNESAKPCSAVSGKYSRDLDSALDGRPDGTPSARSRRAARDAAVQGKDRAEVDLMKQLLVRKYHRRKPKKPLDERIEEFLKEIEGVKLQDVEFSKAPEEWEKHRRWKVITHGVKAALADSSDEEDANPDHTL